ncbi:MAG TPA: hypothetical protein VFR01_00445, partial [Geobacterales bacterium]|nr:hypothetical protein [Geobacterales bacterium]
RLLSLFHYIVAGVTALFACFPGLYVFLGIMMLLAPPSSGDGEMVAAVMGWIFICIGAIFMIAGWALATCMALSGRFLAQRKKRTFSLVVAAISCLFVPFGTILGVFTIIVIMRPSVQELYVAAAPPVAPR